MNSRRQGASGCVAWSACCPNDAGPSRRHSPGSSSPKVSCGYGFHSELHRVIMCTGCTRVSTAPQLPLLAVHTAVTRANNGAAATATETAKQSLLPNSEIQTGIITPRLVLKARE